MEIDKSVTPKQQHVRRIPIALRATVDAELDRLEKLDVIEKVVGTSEWVSPMTITIKDNGACRICVDMRQANLAIVRERHLIPTLDDFLSNFHGATLFSRLDIKEAYHQIELAENCRYITTFIAPKGMYRYKRLMFGVSCAPEKFQKIMEQILSSCPNTLNFQDDIIVWGTGKKDHDQSLKTTLDKLNQFDVLLNHNKCEYGVEETEFLGHKLSKHGVRPSPEKIELIKNLRRPNTAEEIRSFLGLVQYMGRFLPNLATETHELRELMKVGGKLNWEDKHDREFRRLKIFVAKKNSHFGIFQPQTPYETCYGCFSCWFRRSFNTICG